MLQTISVLLIILWMVGLGIGFTMGSFFYILFAASITLLMVNIIREVTIGRKLRHVLRGRSPKTG